MRVLFVNPPNDLYDRKYLAPPLGLLTLASVVKVNGHEAQLIDLNLEVLSRPQTGDGQFYDFACELILAEKVDAICFTSMCLESHVALELARRLKQKSPSLVSIFGGTHFGAIASETLSRFLFVDYVVAGEGEQGLLAILNHLSKTNEPLPANVWHREEGRIVTGKGERIIPSLEDLPFPSYELVDLQRYFTLNPNRLLNYEAGRGCVFKCSFCYSPFHYGDAVRNKSADSVVADLRRLCGLGARHVFFVQDNLLNSRRWALELFQKVANANLPLTWEGYATYPQLDEQLVDSLAQAGCVGLFTGIDAVSAESQKRMQKPFLKNWENTRRKLLYCREKEILPMCAFILEGPNQRAQEVDATIQTALHCINLGCEVHLNTLTRYNGTALRLGEESRAHHYSQIKPELLLDTPEVVQDNHFAKTWPHLFPYHSTVDDVKDWERFTAKAYTLWSAIIALQKTCYQFAIEEGNSLWEALAYVDDKLVEIIRHTPVPKRRLHAIIRFANNLALFPLTPSTRSCLRREVARVVLSAQEEPRVVSLSVNGCRKGYSLGWFTCLLGSEFVDDIAHSEMLECPSESKLSPDSSLGTFELALRSQGGVIKFYVLSRTKLTVLLELAKSSAADSAVNLSLKAVSQLEDEGWIWSTHGSESGVSGLGNGVRAA